MLLQVIREEIAYSRRQLSATRYIFKSNIPGANLPLPFREVIGPRPRELLMVCWIMQQPIPVFIQRHQLLKLLHLRLLQCKSWPHLCCYRCCCSQGCSSNSRNPPSSLALQRRDIHQNQHPIPTHHHRPAITWKSHDNWLRRTTSVKLCIKHKTVPSLSAQPGLVVALTLRSVENT